MKIKTLTIENFLVIGHAEINLDNRGLLLVQGENCDDTSSNSNGAGKSSIVDAISWCIYGETARGIVGDDVVNNKVGKGCAVSLMVEDSGDEYQISRHRKHSVGKNNLTVVKKSTTDIDITKGTSKLTQDLINKIIGCSKAVFMAAVYSGQEAMQDLPKMTDKELKLIVEEAAGIERLQAAHELAVLKGRTADAKCSAKRTEGLSIVSAISDKKSETLELVDEDKRFKKDLAAEIDELFAKVVELKKVMSLVPIPSLHNYEAWEKEIAKITTQIEDSQGKEKEALKSLDRDVSAQEMLLATANAKLVMSITESKRNKVEIDKVEERVGTPCNECGKEYHVHDIADAKVNAQAKLKESLLKLKTCKEAKESYENLLKIALTARKSFIDAMIDVSALLKRQSALRLLVSKCDDDIKEVKNTQTEISRLELQLEKLKAKESPYLKIIKGKAEQIEELVEREKSVTAELLILEEELEIIKAAVEVFGRAGVRAHILDTVTPFLNDRTAEYLGTLTDGNIVAAWSTIGRTAKGELREKFGIDVSKKNGSSNFAGLSGGEKRKVRLSASMALSDLVATRASKPIEFLLCDELDDALDVSGLERLMTILDKKGKDKGTVLIISHNSLSDWVSDVITVRNTGGISEVIDV